MTRGQEPRPRFSARQQTKEHSVPIDFDPGMSKLKERVEGEMFRLRNSSRFDGVRMSLDDLAEEAPDRSTTESIDPYVQGRNRVRKSLEESFHHGRSETYSIWAFGLCDNPEDVDKRSVSGIKIMLSGIMSFYHDIGKVSEDIMTFSKENGDTNGARRRKVDILFKYLHESAVKDKGVDCLSYDKAKEALTEGTVEPLNDKQMREIYTRFRQDTRRGLLDTIRKSLKNCGSKYVAMLTEYHTEMHPHLEVMTLVMEKPSSYVDKKILQQTIEAVNRKKIGRLVLRKRSYEIPPRLGQDDIDEYAENHLKGIEHTAVYSVLKIDAQGVDEQLNPRLQDAKKALIKKYNVDFG
ncbi:MAG: hypothetical protein U9O94_00145 [Nanoarchaeota archaeon]|nr:hypothetical protein [Nanoarchaeota archaeon]